MAATNLVIVESKGKVATITKYLNSNPALQNLGKFVVVASFGHIRDLPKKDLGIDITSSGEFRPKYELLQDKKQTLDDLLKKSKSAKTVYLASDADSEGEFIAESLRVVLGVGQNYKRITFTEITSKALENAILHPSKIDPLKVDSQQCRRLLDRLVGFKLSPLLWKRFSSKIMGLSAGRVQSSLLHMIIAKEKDISKFESSSYWHINGDFTLEIDKKKTLLEGVRMYKGDTIFKTEHTKQLQDIFKNINNKWKLEDVKNRTTKQKPDLPFITSTIQQEASSKLRMSIKRVMQVAQELYEGGFITYMRTDSYNMSADFKAKAQQYIMDTFGNDYFEGGITKAKTVKGAQEAHECIRVTNVEQLDLPGEKWEKHHKDLYKMIWQRSVAYLMKSAVFDELEVKFKDTGMPKDTNFVTTFKKIKFNGYLIVYGVKAEEGDFNKSLNALKDGKYILNCNELRAKNTWTSPPQRYNEASLVKLMEQTGIGRPSSYSSILDKLFTKSYVIKTDIKGEEQNTKDYLYKPTSKNIQVAEGKTMVGAETSKVLPTDVGLKIDEFLVHNFEYIVDKNFTAYMEKDLDEIAEGTKKKDTVLTTFWKKFDADLKKQVIEKGQKKEKKVILEAENNEVLVHGKPYIIRLAKYGPVIQYDGNKYINLKPYLLLTKKQYTDIDETDIKFLTELPRNIAKIDGRNVEVVYGQYGLYLKYDGKNVAITRKTSAALIKRQDIDIEELKSAIEYSRNKKPAEKPLVKGPEQKKKKVVVKKT